MTATSTGAAMTRTDPDGVATITLQSPGLSARSRGELLDALQTVASDDAGRASCVGQDLSEHVEALRARELLLLPESFSAETALPWGLVHRVVEPDQVLAEAQGPATPLAQGPTAAHQVRKTVLATGATDSLKDTPAREARLRTELGQTAGHREAVEAFLAELTPTSTGR